MKIMTKQLIIIFIFTILYSFAGITLETPALDRLIFSILGVFNALAVILVEENRR